MDPATGMETCKTRQKKYIWFHQKLGFWEGSIVSPGLGGLPSKMVRVKGFLLYMDIVVSPGLSDIRVSRPFGVGALSSGTSRLVKA